MKQKVVLYLALLLFTACEKIETTKVNNLNNGKIYVIGHAGEGFYSHVNHYPFNSKGSISRAFKFHRVDGVEIDFQLTRDHKGILYHDDYLDTQTDCGGSVYHFDYDDLLKCRYTSDIFPALFQNEHLIGLDEVYRLAREVPDPKPILFLDIKLNPTALDIDIEAYKDSMVSFLTSSIMDYQADKIHFISEDESLLIKLKKASPISHFHIAGGQAQRQIHLAIQHGFTGIIGTEDDYEKEDTAEAHRNNLSVTLFSVYSLDDINDVLELNPDYIQTDNIPLLQSVLSRPN